MEPKCVLTFDCAHIPLPSHSLFVGASESGKTQLALFLMQSVHLFNPRPQRIIFHFDRFQAIYVEAKAQLKKLGIDMTLNKGCEGITLESVTKTPCDGQTILFIDDFSHLTSKSLDIARIVTNGRHERISVWLAWHSLFTNHDAARLIRQNVRFLFFLPSLTLESQLAKYGDRLRKRRALLEAFQCMRADTSARYRYIVVDSGSQTPPILAIRSHIHCPIQYCYT